MEHFHIIQALCRTALVNPSNAVIQQVERLKQALQKEGKSKEAKSLETIINGANKICEMAPSKLKQSFVMLSGEELTEKVLVPVDKETATPLAEIYFPNQLPTKSPVFREDVRIAIESILNEWDNFEKLFINKASPSGTCLIYGPPGTGKTQLALWIAGQLETPVVLARIDGLMSSFLGTTSKNIGNLFAFASKYRCILLIDEFDAIAKLRDDPQEVGEIKRVVNALLQNLDFRKNKGLTIGITNHEALLDPAIWRRFEIQLKIPKPSNEVMQALLKEQLPPLLLEDSEVNFLAWCIEGGSGADAESLVRWLKKSYLLEETTPLIKHIKRFALLNSGRIEMRKKILLESNDETLTTALLTDNLFSFKQKEVAALLGKTASSLSKQLAKVK